MPTPALGDIFAWLIGISAICFCVIAIILANRPLLIPPGSVRRALATVGGVEIRNSTRVTTLVLMSLAVMAVWVFILKDRWSTYEQSLNLLGVVARRKSILTDHAGKVGKSECRKILLVERSHKAVELVIEKVRCYSVFAAHRSI